MRLLLVEEILDPDREGDVPLSQADRKALLERIRRGDKAIEEARELKAKIRRVQEQLRRHKACAPMLAASDRTAEVGSIPSSRVFYRRPVRL